MVQSKSNPRLSRISQAIILTQTDTTVGFVSQNKNSLQVIKERTSTKPFLKVYSSNKELSTSSIRIPQVQKNLVRRKNKTTFIVKNKAFRIAKYHLESQLLRDLKWNFSTSANEKAKTFVFDFCEDKADIIIQDKEGLQENSSSQLIKLSNTKKVRLR